MQCNKKTQKVIANKALGWPRLVPMPGPKGYLVLPATAVGYEFASAQRLHQLSTQLATDSPLITALWKPARAKNVIALYAFDLCTGIRPLIGAENLIPEEVNYTKIAIRVPVMNKMQLLPASEPRKPLKPRSLYVIFLVEKDVRVKRRRACDYHHHKKI